MVIRTKVDTRRPMIKINGRKKALSVKSMATQRLIVQKAIIKTSRNRKLMMIIPELVYPVNQASLISTS